MVTTSAAVQAQGPCAGDIQAGRKREHLFYSSLAITMAVTCFVGFAPSYFLRSHFTPTQELPAMLHLHGAAFSLWIVLLVTQTSLVASGNTHIHRKLGVAGGGLAVLMMVLGTMVAITRAKQGLLGNGVVPPLVFLAIPFATLVVFPTLIGSALYFRRRPDIHKRLIMLGTVEMLTAAVARLPVVSDGSPPVFFGVADLFLAAIAIHDVATRGRVHKATIWGGAFLIFSQFSRLAISQTHAWMTFAQWMTGG